MVSAVLATFRLPQFRNQRASRRAPNWLSRALWGHVLNNLLVSLNQEVLNLNTVVKAHTVCEIWNHRTPTFNHPFGKTGLSWCQFELFVVLGCCSCLLCDDQAQSHHHSMEVSGSRSLTSKHPNTSKELFETGSQTRLAWGLLLQPEPISFPYGRREESGLWTRYILMGI